MVICLSAIPTISYNDKLRDVMTMKGGQQLTIEATITGIPAPSVTWTFNDQPVPADVSTESVNSHTTLTIKQAKLEHTGKYVLSASNVVGSASADFNIVIQGMCLVLIVTMLDTVLSSIYNSGMTNLSSIYNSGMTNAFASF